MDELNEIMDRLDQDVSGEPAESVEEKHRILDEKLSEVHDQLQELDEHLSKK